MALAYHIAKGLSIGLFLGCGAGRLVLASSCRSPDRRMRPGPGTNRFSAAPPPTG
jgi:hypothetical protein